MGLFSLIRQGGEGAPPCGSPRWNVGDEAACIDGRSDFNTACPFVTIVAANIPGLPQGGAPRPPVVGMPPDRGGGQLYSRRWRADASNLSDC